MARRLDRVDVLHDVGVVQLLQEVDLPLLGTAGTKNNKPRTAQKGGRQAHETQGKEGAPSQPRTRTKKIKNNK